MIAIAPQGPAGARRPGALVRLGVALAALLALAHASGCATYSNGTPEAQELMKAGLAAYDGESYKLAAEKMELALAQDPLYALCMAHLGMVYHKQGYSDRGLEECRQSVKLCPDLGEGYDNMGEIYFDLKRYDEAEKAWNEAVELSLALPERARDEVHYSPNFNLGRLYETQHKDERALEKYKTAAANNPRHVAAHVACGRLYYKNKLDKDAETHFKLALEYDAANPIAQWGLAQIALKKEQWEEAIMRLREALRVQPRNQEFQRTLAEAFRRSPPRVAKTLVKMAETPINEGKTDDAIELLRAAEKIDPKNVDVYITMAQAYLTAKPRRIEEAEQAAKKGYAVDPKHPTVRFQLGLAMLGGGKLKPAEDLMRGLRREYPTRRTAPPPSSADIRKYLGTVFFKEKQYRRAEIEWREGLKLAPEDAVMKKNIEAIWATPGVKMSNDLNDKGARALSDKSYDVAKDGFKNAIELDDQFAVAWANLALLYYETGNQKEARAAAKKAIERDPDLGKAHLFLGMIEEKENKLEAAKASYVEAAALTKEVDPEPHFALGCLLLKQSKMREAEDAFLLALEIFPKHCRASYELGKLYAAKGLVEKAEARWKIAAESCPDFPLPLVALANQLRKQGRHTEAKKYLEMSFDLDKTAPEPWMGFAEALKAEGEKTKACVAYLNATARFSAKGRYAEAVEAARKGLEVAPRDPKSDEDKALLTQCHNDLGVGLMETGAFTESLDELKKAADLNPDPMQQNKYLLNIGLCYTKKGDRQRAAETYREILKGNPPIAYLIKELLADLYDPDKKDNPVTVEQAIDLLKQALPQEPNEDRKGMVRQRIEALDKIRKGS